MWPACVCRSLLSERTRTRTTVLATASAMPKISPADQSQPNARASSAPRHGGHRTLRDGSGNGDAAHREQFFDVELEADAEHQQNDADLRQLLGQRGVGDEAGSVRTDQRARQQVTDDRR